MLGNLTLFLKFKNFNLNFYYLDYMIGLTTKRVRKHNIEIKTERVE